MALGPNALVYVLARAAATDTLESLGSTYSAREIANGELTELRICEDDTITRTVLGRATAFGIASETENSPIYYVWKVAGTAQPPVGQAVREWVFPIGRTNQTFTPSSGDSFLWQTGDSLLWQTGDQLLWQ